MDFLSVSKLFWFFAEPSHALVWLLVLGVALSSYRAGRVLILVTVLTLVLLIFVPVGDWAIESLENQYPRGPWPAHVDGILELGGGLHSTLTTLRGVPGAEGGEGRPVATAELARHYPNARIIFSGGTASKRIAPESTVARYIFHQLGLAPGRVIYEERARDTWENFIYSRPLAKPKPGEVWLLVTSAYHMPRAMAIAHEVGWTMQPWPSDYLTTPVAEFENGSLSGNLGHLDLAAHEWIGLIAYRLAGRAR
jgi:uncharacterized SAM-binding protein YcdF (DUF218 family)